MLQCVVGSEGFVEQISLLVPPGPGLLLTVWCRSLWQDIVAGINSQRKRISNLTVKPTLGNSVRVSSCSDVPKNSRPVSMEDVISGEDSETTAIAILLEKIAEDPYDYDSHVAYIRLLRNLKAREELRSAREVFHSIFPFSEGSLLCVGWAHSCLRIVDPMAR